MPTLKHAVERSTMCVGPHNFRGSTVVESSPAQITDDPTARLSCRLRQSWPDTHTHITGELAHTHTYFASRHVDVLFIWYESSPVYPSDGADPTKESNWSFFLRRDSSFYVTDDCYIKGCKHTNEMILQAMLQRGRGEEGRRTGQLLRPLWGLVRIAASNETPKAAFQNLFYRDFSVLSSLYPVSLF